MTIDFRAWVSSNLTVEHMGDNGEWTCVCPLCGRPKLAVNVDRALWQCWTCKWSGRKPKAMLAAALGLSPAETDAYVLTGVTVLATREIDPLVVKTPGRGTLPLAPLPPGTAPLQGIAQQYARHRRIPDAHSRAFGLSSVLGDHSGTIADRLLFGRLLIPAYDQASRLVYWQCRATDDHEIKTLNCPRSERHDHWGLSPVDGCAVRSEVLVGLHLVERGEPVVVVEGPVDAAVCGPRFVSTLGAVLSVAQAALLAASGASEVVVMYDPDEAGQRGAEKALRLLRAYLPARSVDCPPGLDPADLGRERALSIVASAHGEQIGPLGTLARASHLRGFPEQREIGALKKFK